MSEETQIIRRASERNWVIAWFLKWQPTIVRGGIYFCIAFLTPMVAALKATGPSVVINTWTWLDWVTLDLECALNGFIVLRTYMDGSFTRHAEKVKQL